MGWEKNLLAQEYIEKKLKAKSKNKQTRTGYPGTMGQLPKV